MKPRSSRSSQPGKPSIPPAVLDALAAVGKAVSHASLYGPEHRLTGQAAADAHEKLSTALARKPRINLAMVDGKLRVNDKPVPDGNALVLAFAAKLKARRVSGFTIVAGLSSAETAALVTLMATSREVDGDNAFREALKKHQLIHILAEKSSYKRVSDDDTVVERDELEDLKAKTAGGGKGGGSFVLDLDDATNEPGKFNASNSPGGGVDHAESAQQRTQNILAFLKGEPGSAVSRVGDDVREAASDPEKLASLIMEAAVIRQRSEAADSGESLADLLVGCLRRAEESLSSPESDKPKPEIRKSLLMLEKSVLEKLHKMMDGVTSYDTELFGDVGEEEEELKIDSLAMDYVQRREALSESEQHMLKVLGPGAASSTVQQCRDALNRAGLGAAGWRELLVKRETHPGGGEAGLGLPSDIGVLTALLTQLDDLMKAEEQNGEQSGEMATRIEHEVNRVTGSTRKKITSLGHRLQMVKDRNREGEETAFVIEEALHERLSEIVQELCQPATALNCAVSLVTEQQAGPLNEQQQNILGIAVNCGDKLMKLLDYLRETIGLPADTTPQKPQL